MADTKLQDETAATTLASTDLFYAVLNPSTTPIDRKVPLSVVKSSLDPLITHKVRGLVSNPQAVYTQRAQIVMFRADAALTITRIHIACYDYSPTAELAGDLKFADDINNGGFANATIIDVCDTTNGVKTITTGFDDATVPSGKYVYFQMDASPHADIKDFYIEVYYTYDAV